MADFNQARSQEVIYTLSHDSTESLELTNDPIGWDNDMKEFVSSDDYAGLISRFSTNLEFVKEAVDYMEDIYAEFGPEADIYLNKKIMHPTEMKRVQSYDAILDGYSIKREGRTQDRRIKINALGSTLLTTLKAKQNEKINIDSLETLDGTTLTPLTRQKVEFPGKKLLLVSKWEISEAQKQVLVPIVIFGGTKAVVIPLKLVAPSDDYVQDISNVSVPTSGASYGPGETGNMFYLVNDRVKTLDWVLDLDMDYIGSAPATIRLDIVTYTGGINYVFDNYQTLATASGSNSGNLSYNGVINVTDLPADASLALVLHITSANSQLLTFNTADLTQTEDSAFDPSINEALLPFEYINRKLQILTNRTDTVLHSPYFGRVDLGYDVDGPGAYQLITCGWWMREFTEKTITSSWKNDIDSIKVMEGVDIGIKIIGDKEMLVVDDSDVFYPDDILIRLPSAAKVKTSINEKLVYSSIITGYKEGGADYEESMGLEEPMGMHTYSAPVSKIENELSLVSVIQRDPTSLELARRKAKSVKGYATTDTRYDDKIFMLDCKEGISDVFALKTWEDHFTTEPTGVFSPETYFNYKYTPKEILLKHKRKIGSGLYHYPTKILKCTPTVGKATLVTEDADESADVLISDLGNPYYKEKEIEFEHKVNYAKMIEIEGETFTGDSYISNINGIAEVKDDDGNTFLVRLQDIKPNKGGKFKTQAV